MAVERCPACGRAYQFGRSQVWTRDKVIEAIQAWADKHGSPPTDREWEPTIKRGRSPEVPRSKTVKGLFGSWNAGIEAAGFPTRSNNVSLGGGLKEAAVELGKQNLSATYIADLLGVQLSTASTWLRAEGIYSRTHGGSGRGPVPRAI